MLMCQDLAAIASDYIEGRLGVMERLSVKSHLMMCRHCRSFVGNLRESMELIRRESADPLDETYARRIDEAIQQALEDRDRR
ncbi:transcriptional regulator [Tamilnaduibacter salinus]|uniref:Transcriptional regulator n=1 Tax=Tamilnaduibacter salinus TaxID=1484056 RepID=A0A2A2I312_9GAMM|nr:zf-HC2 domain-containing protein [Tamilnaduibacter salinus]PAV26109.1 transcriptional regulator [Tamilnaduibacter salinus]